MDLPRVFAVLTRACVAVVLLALLALSPAARAQQPSQNDHIVSPSQLQQQIQTDSASRQKNIDSLTSFLSTPLAEQAMQSAHVSPTQVKTAIPNLSDAELAQLSARAAHAQSDFAAGLFGIGTMLLIILILVVIILVAVVH